MLNTKDSCNTCKVISSFKDLNVILTDGNRKVANIATISNIKVISINDLILKITGNKKNDLDVIYINVGDIYYELSFEIVSSNISIDNLKTYMLCNEDKVDFSFEIFEYCRVKDKLKQVRLSSSGGKFLDWYSSGKRVDAKISLFDGMWINGTYIRILPVVPPSVELNISEILFEMFNGTELFTSVGSYDVYVPGTSITSLDSYYEKYITINGIVIPDLKSFSTITNNKIIATDKNNKQFIIYSDKKEDSENIA
jgi:hypothetical protein